MYAERRFGRVVVSLLTLCLLTTVSVGVAVAAGNTAQDGTIIVDEDGGGDYESIQTALNLAEEGDTIRVRGGTYDEFGVDKNVTVTTDSAVVEGQIAIVDSAAPVIEGFTLRDSKVEAADTTGAWTLRDVTAPIQGPFGIAVETRDSTGDWQIVESELGGIDAKESSGNWTLADTTVRGPLLTDFSEGDWTVRNTFFVARSAIHEKYGQGFMISAVNTAGNWTIRRSAVTTGGESFFGRPFAADFSDTGGSWRVVDSYLRGKVYAEKSSNGKIQDSYLRGDIEFFEGGEVATITRNTILGFIDADTITRPDPIDLTGNYWGQPGGPREGEGLEKGQCRGNVDCSNALDSSPVGSAAAAIPNETLVVGGDGEYDSIQTAIDAAQPTDIVRVESGTYDGFEVDKTVRIAADGAVINGTVGIKGAAAPVIEGLEIDGVPSRGFLFEAGGTTGSWTLRDVIIAGVVRADDADGNWQILDSELGAGNPDNLLVRQTSGDWRIADSTVRGPLVAMESEGDWTISDTVFDARGVRTGVLRTRDTSGDWTIQRSAVIRNEEAAAIDTIGSTGAWTVRDSYLNGAVFADSTESWTIRGSYLAGGEAVQYSTAGLGLSGTGREQATVTGNTILGPADIYFRADIDRTGEIKTYDLRGNYWGQPGGPREDQCQGNVDCGRALDASSVDLPEVVREAIPDGVDIPPPNQGPTAIARADRPAAEETVYARAGETVTFDGGASIDPEGSIRSYEWTVDGAVRSSGEQFRTTFAATGRYRVTLTVSDGQRSNSETISVEVLDENEPLPDEALGGGDTIVPMADLTTPVETVPVGESLRLSAGESVDPDGEILEYRWDVDGDGTVERTTTAPAIRHAFDQSGSYEPSVTVVDSAGATATATTTVRVAEESAFPTAVFDVGPAEGDELVAGTPVGFSAADSSAPDEIVAYEWNFGDGTTRRVTARGGDQPRPTARYSYEAPGEYTVTLTVTAESGLQRQTTRTITVGEPAVPQVGSVDTEKPGQMIRGIGLQNSYTVPVSSQADIDSVVFEFSNGQTREATRARGFERRAEQITGRSGVTVWTVDNVNIDTVTDPGANTVEVRATDDQGQTGTTTFTVGAFEPPAWFESAMGDPTVTRDDGQWVLQSNEPTIPPGGLPGPNYDLSVPVEEIAGQYDVGIGANYGFEYVFAQSRATATGSGALSLTTPVDGLDLDADIGAGFEGSRSGGVSLEVRGTVRVTENAQRAVFERGRVAFGTQVSGTIPLAGVAVYVPAADTTIGIANADLRLTTGFAPAVELAVDDTRTRLELSAIDLTQSLDVNVTAGVGSSVALGGSRVGVEARGIAGGGVEFTTEVYPEIRTDRVLVELRAGVRACLGPCGTEWVLNDDYPLRTENNRTASLEVLVK